MRPVDKVIWYIESHYRQSITLDMLAESAGVSRFHLSHAFSYATGMPVTRYLRCRRLSQAAHALAAGENDILDLALSLGYASHEAFSRAFKDYTGRTPEQVRRQGHTDNLNLLEVRLMSENTVTDLPEPRIVSQRALLLAGLTNNYSHETSAGIPGQWQEFNALVTRIPGRVDGAAFGVVHNSDDNDRFDYTCGVEVADFSALPGDMDHLRIPEQRYAVFPIDRHISAIRALWHTIWSEWLPGSEHEAADAPIIERYPESFDPDTGMGGFELWLPVK